MQLPAPLPCFRAGLLAGLLFASFSVLHAQQSFPGTLVEFDDPFAASFGCTSGCGTSATGVNDFGYVVGYYNSSGTSHRGFLRSPTGEFTEIDVPGASSPPASDLFSGTTTYALNDEGTVAGYYLDQVSVNHSFLRFLNGSFEIGDDASLGVQQQFLSLNLEGAVAGNYATDQYHGFIRFPDGRVSTFDPQGSSATFVCSLCLNAFGAVTGYFDADDQATHGFLREPGGDIISFDVPGSAGETLPTAINDLGAVTGSFGQGNGYSGFIRNRDGTFVTFSVPGAVVVRPTAINLLGIVTGTGEDEDEQTHAFLRWPNGSIVTFDAPGSVETLPSAINAYGLITGTWYDARYVSHGFLYLPW